MVSYDVERDALFNGDEPIVPMTIVIVVAEIPSVVGPATVEQG